MQLKPDSVQNPVEFLYLDTLTLQVCSPIAYVQGSIRHPLQAGVISPIG